MKRKNNQRMKVGIENKETIPEMNEIMKENKSNRQEFYGILMKLQ